MFAKKFYLSVDEKDWHNYFIGFDGKIYNWVDGEVNEKPEIFITDSECKKIVPLFKVYDIENKRFVINPENYFINFCDYKKMQEILFIGWIEIDGKIKSLDGKFKAIRNIDYYGDYPQFNNFFEYDEIEFKLKNDTNEQIGEIFYNPNYKNFVVGVKSKMFIGDYDFISIDKIESIEKLMEFDFSKVRNHSEKGYEVISKYILDNEDVKKRIIKDVKECGIVAEILKVDTFFDNKYHDGIESICINFEKKDDNIIDVFISNTGFGHINK